MNPKFRIFLYRIVSAGLKMLYALCVVFTCAFTAVYVSSPFILGYLVVLNKLGKPVVFFNGDYLYLWLSVVTVLFIPLLIYSIIYRIRQRIKAKKALRQAQEEAKKEKVKENK